MQARGRASVKPLFILACILFLTTFIQSQTVIHENLKHFFFNNPNFPKVQNASTNTNKTTTQSFNRFYETQIKKVSERLSIHCSAFNITDDEQNWPKSQKTMSKTSLSFFDIDLPLSYILEQYKTNSYSFTTFLAYKLQYILVVWGLFCIFGILFYLLCCCQAFCTKKYRVTTRCCMVDFNKETKNVREKNCLLAWTIIIGLMIIASCVLSLINDHIFLGFKQTRCGVLSLNKDLLQPDLINNSGSPQWQGVNDISLKIEEITLTLRALGNEKQFIQEQTKDYKEKEQQLLLSFNQLNENLDRIYNQSYNKRLNNPDPFGRIEDPFIESPFIKRLGPSNVLGTVTWKIAKELESRKTEIEIIDNSYKLMNTLADKSSDYIKILLDSKSKLEKFVKEFYETLDVGINFIESQELTIIVLKQLFFVFFIMCIVPVVFGILGACLVRFGRILFCNFLVHISWILSGALMITCFALLVVLFIFGVGNHSSCKMINLLVEDPFFISNFTIPQHILQPVEDCLYKSQDLAPFYNFYGVLADIDRLDKNITYLQDLKPAKVVLQNQISILQRITEDLRNAADLNSNTNNPVIALAEFNKWSNSENLDSKQTLEAKCSVLKDEWVFSSTSCKYQNRYSKTQPASHDLGYKICITVKELDKSFATKRYTPGLFDACSTDIPHFTSLYTALTTYYDALHLYKESVQSTFQPIHKDLTEYSALQDELDRLISQEKLNIIQNINKFEKLRQAVSSDRNGLISNLKCNFIKEGVERFQNGLCVTTMNGVFFIYIFIIIIAFLLMIFGLLMCVTAIRVLPRESEEERLLSGGISVEMKRNSVMF